MATPGFPPPFGAPSGPNTASPSEADIDPGARLLSRYLEGTRRIVSLSAQQLPSLTPQECQSFSPGESVLLPLLCSTIHALNSIGLRVDELHTRMHGLGSQVANSLIGPEIRDLRNSVSDLSRRVAPLVLHPTPSSSVLTPSSNSTSGKPNRPSAPPPAVPSDTPPNQLSPPHPFLCQCHPWWYQRIRSGCCSKCRCLPGQRQRKEVSSRYHCLQSRVRRRARLTQVSYSPHQCRKEILRHQEHTCPPPGTQSYQHPMA